MKKGIGFVTEAYGELHDVLGRSTEIDIMITTEINEILQLPSLPDGHPCETAMYLASVALLDNAEKLRAIALHWQRRHPQWIVNHADHDCLNAKACTKRIKKRVQRAIRSGTFY